MENKTEHQGINRREFLARLAGGAAALSLPFRAAAGESGPARKPNIVFIECDSMDGRAMGCAGLLAAYTPNMDKLAARGTLFLNNYCNSPQCCPSRASMWSGQHTHRCEGWNNHKGLEPGVPTFQNHLEGAGYRFQTFGKLDYRSGGHGIGAALTAWTVPVGIALPEKSRPSGQVLEEKSSKSNSDRAKIRQTIDWLKQNAGKSDSPFFLYCGLGTPHPPYRTSRKWFDKIDPAKVTLPPYEEKLHPVIEFMAKTKNTFGPFTNEEILNIRRTYYAMIADLDDMVGEAMKAVDDLGLADSTYFIFTSDHGDMNMEHRLYLKNALYEGSARVPLIIAGPGVKAGQVVTALSSLLDMYPTFMDMAGLSQPEGLDGHSLMPELKGQKGSRPDWVLSQYHSNMTNTGIFMLRKGDWKYIAYAGYEPQLFNLKDDPDEMRNLAAAQPEKAREMDAELRKVCDYPAVDAKAKQYDKRSFIEYRDQVGGAKCHAQLAATRKGWSAKEDEMIAKWLGEPAPFDKPPAAGGAAEIGLEKKKGANKEKKKIKGAGRKAGKKQAKPAAEADEE